jgi:hypothetical protein
MRLLALALALFAAPAFAADPTLYAMTDAQFKAYATAELEGSVRAKKFGIEMLREKAGQCAAGDKMACRVGVGFGARSAHMGAESKVLDVFGAAKGRNDGKQPAWIAPMEQEYLDLIKQETDAVKAMRLAAEAAL